jgi:hypothetical protein
MSSKLHAWFALVVMTGPLAVRGQVSVSVFDSSSERPIPSAGVKLSLEDGTEIQAESDARGRADFAVQPGAHRLKIEKQGYADLLDPERRGHLAVSVNSTAIGLARTAVVAGQALDSRGRPLQGAGVIALVRRSVGGEMRLVRFGQLGHTDDNGRYRLHGLPPGHYTVAVIPEESESIADGLAFYGSPDSSHAVFFPVEPGEIRTSVNLTAWGGSPQKGDPQVDFAPESLVKPDEDSEEIVSAIASGGISCAVTAEEGKPATGVVLLSPADGKGRTQVAHVDANSRCQFAGVPIGKYRLMAVERLNSIDYLDPVEAPTVVVVEAGRITEARLVQR